MMRFSVASFLPSRLRWASFLVVILLGFAPGVAAQSVGGRWQAHTSFREVLDLSISDRGLWAATSGGIFHYATSDGELQAYTASDGLHGVQTRVVAHDARRGVVWIGYQDGVLDRVNAETGEVRSFRDIARADRFAMREVNRIVVYGDSLFVATSFGLVVFDPVRAEVRDTYSQLGGLAPGTAVFDVMLAPTATAGPGLWLATAEGVAVAPLSSPNLKDPKAWTVETTGLPATEVRALAFFQGRIYAGTSKGLAARTDAGRYENLGVSGSAVTNLIPTPDRLLGVEEFALVAVEASGVARRLSVPGYLSPTDIRVGPEGGVWVSDRESGLAMVRIPPVPQTEVTVERSGVYPDGPYHNAFSDLVVDAAGSLWAAGVLESPPEWRHTGFYRLDPEGNWTNYIATQFTELAGRNSYERIHADPLGRVWAGAAGAALARVDPEGDVAVFDETNSTLRAPTGITDADYILIGGIGSEKDGTVWVTNRGASQPLHVQTSDGQWTGLSDFTCGGLPTGNVTFDRILVDSFGQKWIVVHSRSNLRLKVGLLALDTGNTPTDERDDVCRFFNEEGAAGQQLPSLDIRTLIEDRDGIIWVGTAEGLAFIINSGVVASDASAVPVWPQYADRSRGTFLLYGVQINDLAVDPGNRIWVATDQGAYLVQQVEGGYEIVQSFQENNSPLLSNDVVAVTVQPQTGRVFFATNQGLVSYEGDAIAPAEQVADLLVYPNPVRIADGAEPSIFIEGLVEATELRIVASHGEVVARIATRGGRTRWDGRDLQGRLVPSGVYLVVAVGENGEGAAYGKVAVIR